MIEIIKEILSHLLMIIATTIATLIGGWAAFDYFVQKRKEKKQKRTLAKQQTEKQYDVFLSYTKTDIEHARQLLMFIVIYHNVATS
jgi:uncharacterized protein YxeA